MIGLSQGPVLLSGSLKGEDVPGVIVEDVVAVLIQVIQQIVVIDAVAGHEHFVVVDGVVVGDDVESGSVERTLLLLGQAEKGGGGAVGVGVDFESHAHVVRGAAAAHATMEIVAGGGGDEVVVLARLEFQSAGGGGEGTEGDGEVEQAVRAVAHGHDARLGIGDPAGVVLLLADHVDHVPLRAHLPPLGHGADEVDLIVLADVDDVVGVVRA